MNELPALLDVLAEETISAEQFARLEALVASSPEAAWQYVQRMQMLAGLAKHFAPMPAASSLPDERPTFPGQKHGPRLLGIASLAAALLVALLWWQWPGATETPLADVELTDNSVAWLTRIVGAEWDPGQEPRRSGMPLPPGSLRLKAGLAEIQFYCGATVILEGPADFELLTSDKARCTRGKLRASVPPQASGFTIDTPRFQLVDRGTEFGLQVGTTEPAEVHVFKGRVDLQGTASGAGQKLMTGQALRMTEDGRATPLASDATRFTSAEQLTDRRDAEARRKQRDWLAGRRQWRDDPALLADFAFDDESAGPSVLRNPAPGKTDGAIVGCPSVEGRWPGKRGLEFNRVGDRVRVRVPGQHDALTLVTWVRVDALRNRFGSLLLSDSFPPGAIHWQLRSEGSVVLGVQDATGRKGANYQTPEAMRPETLGQWTQLAVVYDRANRRVSHYVDGRPVSRHTIAFDLPLQIGGAEIGNWNPLGFRDDRPIRNLVGRMDELLILARPLTDPEIERHYQQGKPCP